MSPLDLLDHLNLIDEMSLKTAKIEPGRGTRHLLFRPLVNRMRAGKNTPLPSMFKPKGGKSWEELKADSEANHLALADLVARAGEGDTIAHHPAFGTMTATQTCDLLDSHYEYHLKRFVEPV